MSLWSRAIGAPLAALLGFLGLLAGACLFGFWVIYSRNPGPSTLDYELAKTLLQMGAVSVAAAIVSLLAFNYQHRTQASQRELETERERRHRTAEKDRDERRQEMRQNAELMARRADYVDELLKSTLSRVTESYNAAKRARRQLRALARYENDSGEMMVRASVYDEWMARLNDAQLDLESVKRDVDVSRGAYPSAKEMFVCLKRMEDYLRAVRKEYEEARWQADGDLPLDSLERLVDFIGKKKASKAFSEELQDQYAELRRMVRSNLLNARFAPVTPPEAAEPGAVDAPSPTPE